MASASPACAGGERLADIGEVRFTNAPTQLRVASGVDGISVSSEGECCLEPAMRQVSGVAHVLFAEAPSEIKVLPAEAPGSVFSWSRRAAKAPSPETAKPCGGGGGAWRGGGARDVAVNTGWLAKLGHCIAWVHGWVLGWKGALVGRSLDMCE